MIKADGETASQIQSLFASIDGPVTAQAIQNSLQQIAPGGPEGAEKQVKVLEIGSDEIVSGDEFSAVQIAQGIGVDSRLLRTGSTIGVLRGHYNSALSTIPGVKKTKSTPASATSQFNVDNVED